MVGTAVKTAPAWAVLLTAFTAMPAAAHPEVSPQFVNRYVSFIVVGDRLEAFFTLLYGPLVAADERKRMDTNGDGRVSTAELALAKTSWRKRAPELITVTVDGQPLGFEDVGVQIGNHDGVGEAAVIIEMLGSRALPAGTRRLRVEPGADPHRLGETEVVADLSHNWKLVAGGRGPAPEHAVPRVKFEGPRVSIIEDRSVTFVIRSIEAALPAVSRPKRAVRFTLGAGVLAAIGLAAHAIRRRRRRSD